MSVTTEFSIREGARSEHILELAEGSILKWDCTVNNGFDIEFSIRVKSSDKTNQGTWMLLDPERITNHSGSIDSSDLVSDGIVLPARMEFRMDNEYSWFNPKEVNLAISLSSISAAASPAAAARPGEDTELVTAPQRAATPQSDSSESPRRRDVKTRSDLLWINQVVGEALVRCPPSTPEIRRKLEELKELLKPRLIHVPSDIAII